jgi:hypothetical protein
MDDPIFVAHEHFWDELVLQFYNHTAGCTITKPRFGMIFIQA